MANKYLILPALIFKYFVTPSYAQFEQPSRSEHSKPWTGSLHLGNGPREYPTTMSTSIIPSNTAASGSVAVSTPSTSPIFLFTASLAHDFFTHVAQITIAPLADVTSISTLYERSEEGHGQVGGQGDGNGEEAASNTQMAIIILSSVIGSIILVVLGLLLWHFYQRRQSKKHVMTRLQTPDEHEFEKWRMSSMPATPRLDKNPIPQSPLATPPVAQSHNSMRYYAQPQSPHVFDRGHPRSSSSYGLLDTPNAFDSRPASQSALSGHRYSNSANNVRGYMRHREERTRSTQSLTTRRAPTPLFGDGMTPEEEAGIPLTPKRVRPRSTPLSPLAGSSEMSGDDFDFGFQRRRLTNEPNKRYSKASESSFNKVPPEQL